MHIKCTSCCRAGAVGTIQQTSKGRQEHWVPPHGSAPKGGPCFVSVPIWISRSPWPPCLAYRRTLLRLEARRWEDICSCTARRVSKHPPVDGG